MPFVPFPRVGVVSECRGAVWATQSYSDGGEEENPGWSMEQNTGLKIMGSGG